MTPRPIHRWKSLWLGIFILTFLGWAWAASMNRASALNLSPGVGQFILAQFNGAAGLFYYDAPVGTWDIRMSDSPAATDHIYVRWWQGLYSTGRVIVLPHAIIILLFLLPWLTFLLLRWRKGKHLTDPSSPAPANP